MYGWTCSSIYLGGHMSQGCMRSRRVANRSCWRQHINHFKYLTIILLLDNAGFLCVCVCGNYQKDVIWKKYSSAIHRSYLQLCSLSCLINPSCCIFFAFLYRGGQCDSPTLLSSFGLCVLNYMSLIPQISSFIQ